MREGGRWTRAYRLALHILPAALRRKHGPAMEALFAHALREAYTRGRRHAAATGAAGLWDVLRRGAYERARPARGAATRERAACPSRDASEPRDAPHVRLPTAAELLRRHAGSFATALVALTASMLALYARKQLPALSARGAAPATVADALMLAVPFTVALTTPMAVFVAVLHQFARLRTDGTLSAARQRRGGVRRLVVPVLSAGVVVAASTLVSNTAVLPRANERLATVLAGRPASATRAFRSDREMTVGELRAAARRARTEARVDAAPRARALAAAYEIEVQKKYALAAACVVLALAGMAVSLIGARGGTRIVSRGDPGAAGLLIGASLVVFGAYYALIVTGENLAERLVVSPVVGMWGANALLLGLSLLALLALWRRHASAEPVRG